MKDISVFDVIVGKYADRLYEECRTLIFSPHSGERTAILRTIEPLINEIAMLRAKAEFVRVPAYARSDIAPVPGCGPVLSVEMRDGFVYATRRDGTKDVTWKAVDGSWVMEDNA